MKLGTKVGGGSSVRTPKPKRGKTQEAGELQPKAKRAVAFGKRTGALIVSAAIIVGCVGTTVFLLNKQSEKVTVARLRYDLGPGALITEDALEPFDMVNEDFQNLGVVTTRNDDGSTKSEQIFIEWKDRGDALNKYMSLYSFGGTILTKKLLVDELLVRSPWLEKVSDGMEIYTMSLSSADVYTPIFYPGARIRIRLIYSVDVEDAPAIKAKIEAKEQKMSTGQYLSTGDSIILDAMQTNTLSSDGIGFSSAEAKTVPLSEIIFDQITVVDMLNNSDESIFDLYSELLGMPLEDRIAYVRTQIEGTGTNDFKQKVTPTKLVFSVTRDEASSLAEFENLGGTLKYTLLPDLNEDYSLMTQFSELSGQLQSWLDNAATASFS